jgi:glycosyltransferase involved in cell wall biosynthesis
MPPLRPLWVTETYPPSRGGMAQSCDRIVHALRASGVEIDVVHLSRRTERWSRETRLGGSDLLWPVTDDAEHALRCLWEQLAEESLRPSWTHVVAFGGLLPLLAAPVYAALLGLPLVTLLRGNDLDLGLFSLRRLGLLERALPRSRRVCVVSRDARAKVAALFPGVETEVIPNGIDLAAWRPLAADRAQAAEWRRRTVSPGRRVLGIFGQIKPKKGGLFFLEALAASGLAERFHLLFVGDLGEEVAGWLASERGALVAHSVEPHVDRYALLARYPACDLVVLPSFYDGMPNVLVEAMALGVPLLAARTGGMADILIDGESGWLFAPGDGEGCRQALASVAATTDRELAAMGERCRRVAHERFGHQDERDRYRAVLEKTGAGPSAGPATVPFEEEMDRELETTAVHARSWAQGHREDE